MVAGAKGEDVISISENYEEGASTGVREGEPRKERMEGRTCGWFDL